MGKKKKQKRAPVSEAFAPAVSAQAVWEPEEQGELLADLLQPFPLQETEEAEDASDGDAVPTRSMPVPVPVPLYDEEIPVHRDAGEWWRWALPFGVLALLGLGAYLAAKTAFGHKLWLFAMDKTCDLQYNLTTVVNSILTLR